MKLLVTGGAGFIGANFIHYWLEKYPQDRIVNLDKLTYAGHQTSLADISTNKNYTFVKGDICDEQTVDRIMKNIDTVVHFAAESHVDRSIADPGIFAKTNVLGTQLLLESARKNKVARFHQVSTDEVFGALPLASRKKFSETTAYNPHSPYSASKAAADHFVRAYGSTFGLPYSITNCTNNFGPWQDPEKFIPRMITNLMEGEKIKIYGDGKYVRDWLAAEDHCRAIDLVVSNGRPGSTYCVGGQKRLYNNLAVARMILKMMNKTDREIEFVTDRPGHDRKYAVDWSRIRADLGWKPEYDFETRLARTVKWYKENTGWWKPLKKRAEAIYNK